MKHNKSFASKYFLEGNKKTFTLIKINFVSVKNKNMIDILMFNKNFTYKHKVLSIKISNCKSKFVKTLIIKYK